MCKKSGDNSCLGKKDDITMGNIIREKQPLVTIAIPIYNAAAFLEYAIRSVINQSYYNWELLLMEDGCTDNSADIARNYAELDKRVQFVSDGINRGLVYRLNQSVAMAKGKYYARMDADDIMNTERIMIQVAFLESNPMVDVIGSSAMLINEHNEIHGSQNMGGVKDYFIHPSVMGKTKWFFENKYNASAIRIEDKDLWMRTCKTSVFYNIERPLLFYRAFGAVTLRQVLDSNKRQRKLFRHNNEYNRSYIWRVNNVLKSYCKDFIFIVLFTIGGEKFYMYTRGRNSVKSELFLNANDLNNSIL